MLRVPTQWGLPSQDRACYVFFCHFNHILRSHVSFGHYSYNFRVLFHKIYTNTDSGRVSINISIYNDLLKILYFIVRPYYVRRIIYYINQGLS